MQSWGRAWNHVCLVESGATSILLSPSHHCDERLRHCGCGFSAGGGTVNHGASSAPTIFPPSSFICLPPSCGDPYMCIKLWRGTVWHSCTNHRHGRSPPTPIHRPNRPSQSDWRRHTHVRAHTQIAKTLFIWGKRKEAFLIGFHVIDLWRRVCVHMSAYVCVSAC